MGCLPKTPSVAVSRGLKRCPKRTDGSCVAGFCLVGERAWTVVVERQGVGFIARRLMKCLDPLPRSTDCSSCCHNGLGAMAPPALRRSAPRKRSALFCFKQVVVGTVGRRIVCDLRERFRVAMAPQTGGAKLRLQFISWQRPLAATAARGCSQSATKVSTKR